MSTAIFNRHEAETERFLLSSLRTFRRSIIGPKPKRPRQHWNTLNDFQRRPRARDGQTILRSMLARKR